jgi:hypothetical protein
MLPCQASLSLNRCHKMALKHCRAPGGSQRAGVAAHPTPAPPGGPPPTAGDLEL